MTHKVKLIINLALVHVNLAHVIVNLALVHANLWLSQVFPPVCFRPWRRSMRVRSLPGSLHLSISRILQKHLYNLTLYQIPQFPPHRRLTRITLTGGLESAKAENRLLCILARCGCRHYFSAKTCSRLCWKGKSGWGEKSLKINTLSTPPVSWRGLAALWTVRLKYGQQFIMAGNCLSP